MPWEMVGLKTESWEVRYNKLVRRELGTCPFKAIVTCFSLQPTHLPWGEAQRNTAARCSPAPDLGKQSLTPNSCVTLCKSPDLSVSVTSLLR